MIAISDRTHLLLSTQRALLGRIGESLWGVCVDLHHKVIVLTFYVRPEVSDDEWEDLRVAGTEILADYSEGYTVDEHFVEVTDPSEMPGTGLWAFLRREALTEQARDS